MSSFLGRHDPIAQDRAQMRRALAHEAAYEAAVGSERVQIRLESVTAGNVWRYLGTGRRVRRQALATLETSDNGFPVEIVEIGAQHIDLRPVGNRPIPVRPPRSATLVIDMSWALNRLSALVAAIPGTGFGAVALGLTPPYRRPPQHRPPPEAVESLDSDQVRAVELALNSPVSWILGPPGTGKTTTAAGLVRACADLDLTVHVYAPTHRALDELQDRLDRVGIGYRRMGQDEMGESEAILGTLHWAALARPQQADVVIIDEASMASLPHLLVAAQRADRSLVLMGDYCQLEPVVRVTPDFLLEEMTRQWSERGRDGDRPVIGQAWAEMQKVWRWLGRDTFVAAGIPRAMQAGRIPGEVAALRTQRRMVESICELVNALSYRQVGIPLQTHPSVAARREWPLPALGLIDVDTEFSQDGHCSASHGEASSRLVAYALERGVNPKEVAVVTPTRAQAALLRTRVPGGISIHTAHASQGAEHEVVVLDLSCGRRPPKGFFGGIRPTDAGTRLLTVGASRARRSLFVVADAVHLADACPPGGAVDRMLRYLAEAAGSASVD